MAKRKQPRPGTATPNDQAAALRRMVQIEAGIRTPDQPTNALQISMFLHCGKCLRELKQMGGNVENESPRTYARLSVGWTPLGLQVWCNRHEANVLHVDFEGHQHRANLTTPEAGANGVH